MSAHTPGPWRLGVKEVHDGYHCGYYVYSGDEELWVASVMGRHVNVPLGEIDANAELIARAPEMAARIAELERVNAALLRSVGFVAYGLEVDGRTADGLTRSDAAADLRAAIALAEPKR